MDSMFIDYFSTKLAQRLSYKITQSNSTVERTDSIMRSLEDKARAMDGQENPPKRIERSRNIRARQNRGAVTNRAGLIFFR